MVHFKDTPNANQRSDNNANKSSSDNNDDNKKGDEGDKVLSVVTKAVLWMATIYMFVTMFTMSMPQKNRPETSTRYVSWHEFVHHMLAVGEVRELIIRPDMEMVTILLYDGAVIKGRQYHSTVFHMAVADTAKFETKLRDIEMRLGIRDGVPITYERNSDVGARILITLMMAALLFSIFSRMKGMKSPISMDSFVRFHFVLSSQTIFFSTISCSPSHRPNSAGLNSP